MASGLTPTIRLVRCPKCRKVLPEIANLPVYKCGGCDTVLRAKNQKIDAKSTSSGSRDTDDAEMNNLDHVSEYKESSGSNHSAILPSSGECSSLDENNERDQNIPGDCNSNQLEAINLSHEDQNNGSDQNEPCNRNTERPGVCNEVCSSAELAHCGSEELPPIAGAHSEAEGNDESPPLPGTHSEEEVNDESPPLPAAHSEEEVNDESSPLPGANLEVDVNDESPPLQGANSDLEANDENSVLAGAKSVLDINNESYSSFIRSSNTDNLVASMGNDSTVAAHRPAGESISSDTLSSSPIEPLEQPQNSVHRGFDRARSTDSLETTEFVSPRSEFSGTLEYLSKCPTTRSSHAYDGSVSSYDGVDDQFPDHHIHSFKNAYKAVNSVVSAERLKRDKFPVNRNPELQHQARNFSSVFSNKKHYSTESSQWDQDELLEPARHGRPVRNWPRLERDEYQSQVPFYQRGSSAGYESGSTSSQFHDEFHRNSRFHSPDKPEYTEQEKMKLLRIVCELQDQLNKTCHLNGMANGRVSSGVTWKEKHSSRFYDHEASEEEIYQDLGHPRYHGRLRRGSNWPQQSKFSQIPFSGDAINSRHHQVDHSCLCCHPQDWQCSAQLPPPVLRHNKGFCRVHPCHNSYSSLPSSPQWCLDSEFPIWNRESKSCDQRNKDYEVKKYLREKCHLVKRHLRPTAGGAPFIICYCCLKPLQLPADFLLFKRRCHQLRCGSCSEILKFSLENRTHIVPYTPNAPPPSEVADSSDVINSRSLVSASHANNCLQADPVSCSDDYGLSFCKSCSTDGDPVSLIPFDDLQRNASNGSGQRNEFVLKQSQNKGKKPLETYESVGPSAKVSSEIEELEPRGGSPLHRLMGYSSPSEVIYGAVTSGLGSSSHNPGKVLRSRN